VQRSQQYHLQNWEKIGTESSRGAGDSTRGGVEGKARWEAIGEEEEGVRGLATAGVGGGVELVDLSSGGGACGWENW